MSARWILGARLSCVVAAACLAGCGGTSPASQGSVVYETGATVLESRNAGGAGTAPHGAQLCWIVALSLPPQCGGPDVAGWEWARVDGEETSAGTTWGEYVVRGAYDGTTFTLTEPARHATYEELASRGPAPPRFDTPCPEPARGWAPDAGSPGSDEGVQAVARYADRSPDLSALWADQPDGRTIVNVRFSANAGRHERRIRQQFAGNLCVTQGGVSRSRLQSIQATALGLVPPSNRLGAAGLEVEGAVELTVILDPGELQQTMDERFGPGVIRVVSKLRPGADPPGLCGRVTDRGERAAQRVLSRARCDERHAEVSRSL